MKGDKKIIEHLNKILGNELIAINQYFLHAKMLENWGYKKLASAVKADSIDEMKHADKLTDRILFLEGLPNYQDLGRLRIGQNVREILECDLKLELQAIPDLKDAISYAESIKDYITRDVLREILASEEQHADWLQTQINLFDSLGEQNYLQSQI